LDQIVGLGGLDQIAGEIAVGLLGGIAGPDWRAGLLHRRRVRAPGRISAVFAQKIKFHKFSVEKDKAGVL
jgi:hypothetical protein